MRTIHKYALTISDEQWITMPLGAKPLYVAMQNDCISLWAEVETVAATAKRKFYVVGTEHPLPQIPARDLQYVGTVQYESLGMMLVWHVYMDLL